MTRTIGFIGTGVMGEPMCRNLAQKSGAMIIAYDRSAAPLLRLAAHGVKTAASLAELVEKADTILMVLPSGKHV
jgi:3-hydroxyisobutyrate dehydrogenase-like beta-hydroxyacid dehydrogenase